MKSSLNKSKIDEINKILRHNQYGMQQTYNQQHSLNLSPIALNPQINRPWHDHLTQSTIFEKVERSRVDRSRVVDRGDKGGRYVINNWRDNGRGSGLRQRQLQQSKQPNSPIHIHIQDSVEQNSPLPSHSNTHHLLISSNIKPTNSHSNRSHFRVNTIKNKQKVSHQMPAHILSPTFIKEHSNKSLLKTTSQPPPTPSKSIIHLPHQTVKQYFLLKLPKFHAKIQAKQIYQLMIPLLQENGIRMQYPLIKIYKNCVYFGNQIASNANYQGFLIFLQARRVYFGDFQVEKKNGEGVQIDYETDSVFIGQFQHGKKSGIFKVIRPNTVYQGTILSNHYSGYGQLTTKYSIYNGQFKQGKRHGLGSEWFPDSGLHLTGIFINDHFSNQQKRQNARQSSQKRHNTSSRILKISESTNFQSELQFTKNSREFNYEYSGERVEKSKKREKQKSRVRVGGNSNSNVAVKRRRSIEQEQPLARSRWIN